MGDKVKLKYEAGNGTSCESPIEVLTREALKSLTGQDSVPDQVPLALLIPGLGDTFRVEDIVRHWPNDHIDQDEFDRRLVELCWPGHLFGVGGALYRILHPEPHKALVAREK